ncbi:hypothetical protein LCGC14_0414120 [marine sediment metagenome]|uniref:Uncharacterized protein n=1 Tax=marine sediment metagenome TaxID=412755 RepID=A0A0F9VEW4_9ZZZZ
MCFGRAPKTPEAPPPTLPKKAPRRVDENILAARTSQRESEVLRRGIAGTRLSGPSGFTAPAETANKTLLGA